MDVFQRPADSTRTQVLSSYIKHAKYEDFPPEVIERTKMMVMQVLGVSLAANRTDAQAAVTAIARNAGKAAAAGEATAWVTGEKMSMENAGLINGTLADALDWEDCSWTGHPSAGVIPMAWVATEAAKGSGRDLITAAIVGFEVYERIAMAIQPTLEDHLKRGWGLCSWQIFGALVPILKAMDLEPDQINQALTMATACSVLPTCLPEFTKSDAYHFEHGLRNQTAATLARLARAGIERMEDGLDDPAAYGRHITRGEKPEWYLKELGSRYLILETLLKHWPANMWCQTSVELAHLILTKYRLNPDEIERITLYPGTKKRMDLPEGGFDSITQAQFSIPFVIAAVAYDSTPGAHWYTARNMKDPKVIALAKKVVASDDPMVVPGEGFKMFKEGKYPMIRLAVRMEDGREYQESMDCHPGHPSNMMSREEFVERFRIQASATLSPETTRRAIDALLRLEDCEDISQLHWMLHS